ncbi:MAG: hypothetical protein SFU53_01625 [Terrimicrobiaceae bacterium]|nr:hypothetical protein [Terrimicrobiaceae bacterium]
MHPAVEAALELQEFLDRNGLRFCIIGGIAVQRWGEVRLTVDADATVLTNWDQDEYVTDLLLDSPFVPRRADARDFALRHRVLLLKNKSGTHVDVALGAMDFENRSVSRSSLWRISKGAELRTCSAEDLLVHKTFAGRSRDWTDIEGILLRQGRKLDLAQVRQELHPLLELKDAPESMERLVALCRDLSLEFPTG